MIAASGKSGIWAAEALIAGEWKRSVSLTLRDGLIAAIATGVDPASDDERHDILIPGLPNLHSHAFQRGMAGLTETRGTDADSFWTWREVMYRFVDRMGPDELRAIAALAYAEMLECGFTRVGEFHYVHHDPQGKAYADPAEMAQALAGAAGESGIALTLLPVFYAHSGFGGRAPEQAQRRFVTTPDSFARLIEASRKTVAALPDGVVGIAPHSLRAVSPDYLAAVLPLAGDGPIHIHIAEQLREVEDCVAALGARPVEWLLANAAVGDRWCLVHATHMTGAETVAMVRTGAVAGLCPITEANLGDGLFPAVAYAAAGGRFGVGSDSNVMIDAWEELRLLEYGQRLTLRARNVLADGAGHSTGADLYRAALDGGGCALGADHRLIEGAPADMISLSADHPSLSARHGDVLLDSMVFAAGRSAVDCVWRRGDKLVSGGRHRDRDAITSRYLQALETLIR